MLFGEDMNRSNTAALGLFVYGGILLILGYSLRIKERMDKRQVVTDVELFLKAARLQDLILPEQQEIIDGIGREWISESYQGTTSPISIGEWLRQNRINTSKN